MGIHFWGSSKGKESSDYLKRSTQYLYLFGIYVNTKLKNIIKEVMFII